MSESGGRIALVDQAKALGIVLVVVGHVVVFPRWLLEPIFLFHMPLFFFVSGALHGDTRLGMRTATYARDLIRRLLVPYGFFFAIAYVFWLATRNLGSRSAKFREVDWHEPLLAFASGGALDLVVNPVLWFLPCLALTAATFQFLRRRFGALPLVVSSGLLLLVVVPQIAQSPGPNWPFGDGPVVDRSHRLAWGGDLLPASLFFYAAGHALRDGLQRDPQAWLPTAWRLVIGVLLTSLLVVGRPLFGAVDMNQLFFGRSVVWFMLAGAIGIGGTLMFASLLPGRARVVQWLARNTLIIFALHPLMFIAISGLGKMGLRLSPQTLASPAWGLLQLALTFALLAPATAALHALVPSVVGARSRRRPSSSSLPPGSHSPA